MALVDVPELGQTISIDAEFDVRRTHPTTGEAMFAPLNLLHFGGLQCGVQVNLTHEVSPRLRYEFWASDEFISTGYFDFVGQNGIEGLPERAFLRASISRYGMRLDRALSTHHHHYMRQHMHLLDARLTDAWRGTLTTYVVIHVEGYGGTLHWDSREAPSPLQPQVGGGGGYVEVELEYWERLVAGESGKLAVTANTTGFSLDGGGIGVAWDKGRFVGTGSGFEVYEGPWGVHTRSPNWRGALGGGLTPGATFEPALEQWDGAGFEPPPLLHVGHTIRTADGWEPKAFSAGEIPSINVRDNVTAFLGPWRGAAVDLYANGAEPPIGTIRAPSSRTVAMRLDEAWALANRVCPAREADNADVWGTIEQLSDLYIPIEGAGLSKGVEGGWYALATVSLHEAPVFPLAPDAQGRRTERIELLGGLADLTDGAHLRWLFDEDAWAETPTPGGAISWRPITRYWERMAMLPQQLDDVQKDWYWPWAIRRREQGEITPGTGEPDYEEDLFSMAGAGFLAFNVNKPRYAELELTLTLDYSEVSVVDPHYTCGEWRADEYDWDRAPNTATYTITVPAANDDYYDGTAAKQHEVTVRVDLLCPDEGHTPNLYVIDRIHIDGLTLRQNTRADRPEGYVQGGVVELFDTEAKGLRLAHDTGQDHTGRDEDATSLIELAATESWDYDGDWQGLIIASDGALRGSERPDEPYHYTTERGLGTIQRLEHCPTQENILGRLDFARPLRFVQHLEGERHRITIDETELSAMTEAYNPDTEAVETLSAGFLYWLGSYKRRHGETGAVLDGSVRCRAWELAPGLQYTIRGWKQLYGRIRALLKVDGGRRRLTPGYLAETRQVLTARILRKPTYRDEDGATIPTPSGHDPAGQWQLVREVTVEPDVHGVWATPPLLPASSRIATGRGSGLPAEQTDQVEWQTRIDFWWDADAAAAYALDDEEGMAADPDFAGAAYPASPTTRMWATFSQRATPPPGGRVDLDLSPAGVITLARPRNSRMASETPGGSDALGLDLYSPSAAPAPYALRDTGRYDSATVASSATGSLDVVARDRETRAFQIRRYGPGDTVGTLAASLPGMTMAVLARDPISGQRLVLAQEQASGQFRAARLGPTGAPEDWVTVGPGMPRQPALWSLPSGQLLAALPRDEGLAVMASRDGGATWTADGTIPDADVPTGAPSPATGAPLLLARGRDGWMRVWSRDGRRWRRGGRIARGAMDAGGLVERPDGRLLVVLYSGSTLRAYLSGDRGQTWEETDGS